MIIDRWPSNRITRQEMVKILDAEPTHIEVVDSGEKIGLVAFLAASNEAGVHFRVSLNHQELTELIRKFKETEDARHGHLRNLTFADLTEEYDEWLAQERLVVGADSRPCYPDGMPMTEDQAEWYRVYLVRWASITTAPLVDVKID